MQHHHHQFFLKKSAWSLEWELTLILTSREGLFKGFYIEIRHKVVAKNNFSPLFVLYALKDRKIKLTPRILCHRKIFRCLKMNFRVQT